MSKRMRLDQEKREETDRWEREEGPGGGREMLSLWRAEDALKCDCWRMEDRAERGPLGPLTRIIARA